MGNLGSKERLSFTAVGDGVNLASRLEALNKRYDTSVSLLIIKLKKKHLCYLLNNNILFDFGKILISGEVYEQVKHVFLCRYLDIVVVQGRTQATHIYELVEQIDKASPRDIGTIKKI